ncbi:MAG TPA: YihY/virulence factor BrkB family protein [Steroidobacteraceae bacterium]|nr:YihY/virulence factor BrkB family protein [Steroidobacteraceae bacterium]HRX90875.1 YihY/virulence factor BrkB family protein [Steroidobacteraceae bacterium]
MLLAAFNWLDGWLFGDRADSRSPVGMVLRVLRYPYALLRDLLRGQINLHAMGLVYATLLSLIPLVAFSFAILKVFGAHRDLEPIIYEFFRPLGDAATDLTRRIMEFADNVSTGIVGAVGFALLLWTLISTIKKVEDSFNFVWSVQQARGIGRRITEYAALLIIGPLLLVAFIGLSHVALDSSAAQWARELPLMNRIFAWGISLSPYVVVTAMFTALYMFVPNTRVALLPALIGGLTAGILWAAVGKVFTAMVVYTTRLTIVYAGFAIIIAALLWTYLGWLILLVGARLSFYIQNRNYLRLGLVEIRLSAEEMERLALKIMYLVARSHTKGTARWSVQTLSDELGMPGIAIAQSVVGLEQARLITATGDDVLLPARDIGHITLTEILNVARSQKSGHLTAGGKTVPAVDRITEQLEAAWRSTCADRTLRDLVDEHG